jgi:ABC-type proline/glycine betaine transport system permease subunit
LRVLITYALLGNGSGVAIARSPQTDNFYPRLAGWTFAVPTLSLMVIAVTFVAYYYWNIIAYLLVLPLLPIAYLKIPLLGAVDLDRMPQIRHSAIVTTQVGE